MKRIIFTIALLAIAGYLFFAGNVPSAPPQNQPRNIASDELPLNKNTLDESRANSLKALMEERASGVPFAIQEIEILDAFDEGLSIASIEADVVLSRAIYNAYVAGKPLGKEQELLARYRLYNTAHARDTVARNAELNADHPEARGTMAPDASYDWELYSNPELFNQLSGAYRNRLERIYGHKGKVRSRSNNARGTGTSPEVVLASPNTLVNNPAADTTSQDTQSETTLVRGTGNTIVSSFNDSGSNVGSANHFTGTARSTNTGDTWTDQGILPADANGDAGDPIFARNNTTGTIILATLGFNNAATIPTYRSTTDGASFLAQVDADGGGANNDKEWLACDNFAGSGQGNFYLFYRDFGAGGGMSFTRSTDGGATWSPRQLLVNASGQGAWVVVGADHAVYCFWLASPNQIVFRKSTDLGLTFAAQSTVTVLRTGGTNGDLGLGGGFRTNSFPQIVAHPTIASQLYMVWDDKAVSGTDKANIYFSQTSNGGATWSAPIQVNMDVGTNDQWQPVIAITPDGTGLFTSWYDRRLDGANSLIDVFARHATITGTTVTFGSDYRVTDTAFPVVIGQDPAINGVYMGDYDQAIADNAMYYRTWGDNRSPLNAHAHQPDVRFTKVPKAGPSPAPFMVAAGATLTAESCAPPNSVPDPGEVVTYNLAVMNSGDGATTSLVGTLLATGGVLSPSAPQNYGAVAPGGTVSKSFSFTASGSCGGMITASLQLQDGATNLGTVTYTFTLGTTTTQTFSNPAAISIVDNAAAVPYPSNITASGVTTYSRVTVTLTGITHSFADDIDIILVAPGGQKAYVMSDVGGGGPGPSNVTVTFDDNAAATVPDAGPLTSGTYKPSDVNDGADTFPAPAPAGPYGTTFAGFAGLGAGANGTWALYVRDDAGSDTGTISGGWSLTFIKPVCSSCGPTPTPGPTASPTPTPTPSPTPTPTPITTATPTPTAGPSCTPGALLPWTLAANYPAIIESPAVGSDGTFVYTAGGFNGTVGTNAAYRYNPATNVWTTLAPMPVALYAARGVYAANTNSFYVFGGYDGTNALATTYIYNVSTNIWSTGAPIPAQRIFPNVAYYPVNGKIYVIGGLSAASNEANETYQYDPVANTWASLGNMLVPMGGSATSISGQFIYLVGTWSGGAGNTVHTRYDIAANTWATMAPAPVAVYEALGGAIAGQTYLVGGGNASRPGGQGKALPALNSRSAPTTSYNSTYIYDIASNTWSNGPNTNVPHSFTGGTTVGARLLIVGGYNGSVDTNTVETTSTTCAPCNGDYRVLIVSSDSSVPPNTLRSSLLAEPGITAVDLFDGLAGTPTTAQMQQYDIVVPFSNSGWADQTTLGNNLSSYLAGAGVVVAPNFDWFGGTQSILGTWSTTNTPFNNPATGTNFGNGTLGTCTFSPLCGGVTTLNAFYREILTVASGATQAATWNDASSLMAYKGRAVAINAYVGDASGGFSGQYARVIANSARWLNPGNYVYTATTGSIVPGTTDTGNHTDDGSTLIALPFSYQLYDQTFASVSVGSNGHLTFGTVTDSFYPTSIPVAVATYAIGPYWTDQCTGPCGGVTGTTYGIFTSTSGVSPNRIFNIEWRTAYYNSGGTGIPLNYEVRLYEGQTAFDIVYGTIPASFTPPSARTISTGVQQASMTQFTQQGVDNTGGGSPPVASGQLYHYTFSPFACPPPTADILGTVTYCNNPAPQASNGVLMTLTGSASGSTSTAGGGAYSFLGLASGGSYTVTPSKATRTPGSAGINTLDVIAVQKHFLGSVTIPPGCRLTAANVSPPAAINTLDVIAIQHFFLGLTSATAIQNTGKYQFNPAIHTYAPLGSTQASQNFDEIILGDVAAPFITPPRPGGPGPDAPDSDSEAIELPSNVAAVALPDMVLDRSTTQSTATVTTSAIDARDKLIGFQGDFTFDERVVSFDSNQPVQPAGLTANNWNVSGNVLDGPGPIRTLRISAYSNDLTPLSGTGTLFELRMTVPHSAFRTPHSTTRLLWSAPPDNFIFINDDLKTQRPGNVAPGSVNQH